MPALRRESEIRFTNMKLSKPEEDPNAELDSVDEGSPEEMVEVDGVQMPVTEAVEQLDSMMETAFDEHAHEGEIDRIETAIKELQEAVEELAFVLDNGRETRGEFLDEDKKL